MPSKPRETNEKNESARSRGKSFTGQRNAVFSLGELKKDQRIIERSATQSSLFFCKLCKVILFFPKAKGHCCQKNAILEEDKSIYDRICGVTDPNTGSLCMRNLNCKSHSVYMKRAITKRSLPFDVLVKRNFEERRKRKMEEIEGKSEKREKKSDEYTRLEEDICKTIMSHVPVIDKTFYHPTIKMDTLSIRSIFFQPLKVQRILLEKKAAIDSKKQSPSAALYHTKKAYHPSPPPPPSNI